MADKMKCLQCGACCRQLLTECYWHDAVREPRLLAPEINTNNLTLDDLAENGRCIILNLNNCPFLVDNKCSIYPTRPNTCVGFEPGGEQCVAARKVEGNG